MLSISEHSTCVYSMIPSDDRRVWIEIYNVSTRFDGAWWRIGGLWRDPDTGGVSPAIHLQHDPSASIGIKSQANVWSRPLEVGQTSHFILLQSKYNIYYNFDSWSHKQYISYICRAMFHLAYYSRSLSYFNAQNFHPGQWNSYCSLWCNILLPDIRSLSLSVAIKK